jgi:hydrogenase-4 membrane subunit HyfE
MHILKVFYYNYYCFYKKIIKDPNPHLATVLSLSASEGLLINGTIDIFAIKWYCYQIPVWIQFSVVLILVLANYLTFQKNGKAKKIIREKPNFGNKLFSITITWIFFLTTASWLFWGSIYGKYLLEQCR